MQNKTDNAIKNTMSNLKNQKLQKSESQKKYLMEMASTVPLQKLFVTPHCYSECVDYFIAVFFCSIQNNQVFFPQVLNFTLYCKAEE